MIGIILSGKNDQTLYHSFYGSTVFEYTLDNCLKAEQVQRIVVSAPMSQRKNIKGSGIYTPLIKGDRTYLGRKAQFHFYTDENDIIGALYFAALNYSLDYIVLINANCPVLPAWLINAVIYEYMSNTDRNSYMTTLGYDFAFEIKILPFWMLANEYLYAENRDGLNLEKYKTYFFENKGEFYLPSSNIDLRFTDLSKIEEFEFLLGELSKGADLGELIEDLNEPQEIESE